MKRGIGWAVAQLQAGDRVRRAGWNGKGMWLELVDPGLQRFLPFVQMRTAQEQLVPWLCSQTDLLAKDWELANDEEG